MYRTCLLILITLCGGHFSGLSQATLSADSLASARPFETPAMHSFLAQSQSQKLLILTDNAQTFSDFLYRQGLSASRSVQVISGQQAVLVRLSPKEYRDWVRTYSELRFVDVRNQRPVPERAQERFDLSLNRINMVRRDFPFLDGQRQVISIKEPRFDSVDIDLRGRYLPSGLSAAYLSGHATNMATMIAGSGQSFITGLGVAPAAQLSSTSFLRLFPDPDTYFLEYEVLVQNHSYGLGIENYYGAEARAYDEQIEALPWLTHVFSAGNQGEDTPEAGIYAGLPRIANLTGTFKQAKNILTVGALDSLGNIASRSSRGPAYDGRIKPELTAYGTDGSSGAAAITSGLATLLQQHYQQLHDGMPLDATLLRALLINSARDLGVQGPDYTYGYGMVDAGAALQQLSSEQFVRGVITHGETFTHTIDVPANAVKLRVTLAWIDPPAELQAPTALVHDLDLTLRPPNGQPVVLPWVTSTVARVDSLGAPARRGIDTLNNQEVLSLVQPTDGSYQIDVAGTRVSPGSVQPFYLVYSMDTAGQFTWDFPVRKDILRAGQPQVLRWTHTLNENALQHLDIRYTGHAQWRELAGTASLDREGLRWTVPDTFARAQLRMVTDDGIFVSDTFTIARPLELEVAYQCRDDVLFVWEGIPQARAYRLYQLIEGEMQVVFEGEDTQAVLSTPDETDTYYAIAPVLADGTEALRSLALNLQFQSSPCYTSRLNGQIDGDLIRLGLTLSSLEGLAEVEVEKWIDGSYQPLFSTVPVQRQLTWVDDNPQVGPNQYRAILRRNNGQTLTTQSRTLYYFGERPMLVFPNPVSSNSLLSIFITSEYAGSFFELYNAQGQLVRRYDVLSERENLFLGNLQAGFYSYQLVPEDSGPVASGTLVIQ